MSRILQFLGALLAGLLLSGCDMSKFSEERAIANISSLVLGDNAWPVELSREAGPMWMISIDNRKVPISWGSASPSLSDNRVAVMLKNLDGSALMVVRPGGRRELVPPGDIIELYAGSLKAMAHADSVAYIAPEGGGNGTGFVRVEYLIKSDNAVTFDAPVPLVAYRSP